MDQVDAHPPQDISTSPVRLRPLIQRQIAADFSALSAVEGDQQNRPEVLGPFSESDMPGAKSLIRGEYVVLPPEQEMELLALENKDIAGKQILHIGFGTSRLDEPLTARGARCTLVDRDPEVVASAQAAQKTAQVGDAEKLDVPDRSYDMVILKHLLNPTGNPSAALSEALRVCKPGGTVVLFPVMAFVDVDRMAVPEFTWTRWGLDYFTLHISPRLETDQKALVDVVTNGRKLAVKPEPYWTTARRLNGYYYENYQS